MRVLSMPEGRDPDEVFLVEGHTDAVGSDVDNLDTLRKHAEVAADVDHELAADTAGRRHRDHDLVGTGVLERLRQPVDRAEHLHAVEAQALLLRRVVEDPDRGEPGARLDHLAHEHSKFKF
jgi:hypothetical protein